MIQTIKKTVKTEWFLVKLLFDTNAVLGTVFCALTFIQYIIPVVNVWIWKLALDELTVIYQRGSSDFRIWIYIGIYLLMQILLSLLPQISGIIYGVIERKASYKLDMTIMQKTATVDTSFFDAPENYDLLAAAQTSEQYISGNMTWAVGTITRIISFVTGLIMFLSYNPALGLIYIATYIPGAIISYKHRAKVDQWSIDNIPETRKKNYYKSILTSNLTAKDLRLYDLSEHFRAKYNEIWDKIRAEREKLFVKGSINMFLASLLTYCGIVVIIILSVKSVLADGMLIGSLALYVGLAQTTGENFKHIIEDVACQIEIDVPHVINYIKFLEYENIIKDSGTHIIPARPDVEFRNVSFKYPGNETYTIKNLSFKICGGKKIALIGVNGAGKTTIVKLLLRFYEPESGSILIGGRDIREYSFTELYKMFGVCFQDIQTYSLSLRENIAVSDISRLTDDDAVISAACASKANGIYESLPDGLNVQMTRRFDNNGIELSGGQWQKIALARAFFRDSQFIILDEPSSALDPEAEDYVFSSFGRLCKDKGGILISHRLSSIMMVDEIILLDGGTLLESGTHDELIKKNGKYAEMYRLQAQKYTGGDADE